MLQLIAHTQITKNTTAKYSHMFILLKNVGVIKFCFGMHGVFLKRIIHLFDIHYISRIFIKIIALPTKRKQLLLKSGGFN